MAKRSRMSKKNPKVDQFLAKAEHWPEEMKKLRNILVTSPLSEEIKWGTPCYTHEGANVVLIHAFKSYCALLFFKGALLKDPRKILIRQTENMQSARQVRFPSVKEITKLESTIKAYVKEALEVEKAGLKVKFKKTSEFSVPAEFQQKLKESPELKAAFKALTPGRQRAYLLHFSSAKQATTREARIEKCRPKIMKGKGLLD